ncbi:hypothetical protein E2986_10676 [Frieseomelitta varia]|uniref:Uncharacterized protein n=1 Tax=Frieseomelitta varia TaxID=561572 RepID=A0A833W7I9_9HYME|nr:hypothetical protein E2986_10676 [Frieseomelitta varia]
MSSCRVVRKKCNKEKHEKKNVDSSSPSSLTPVAVANSFCSQKTTDIKITRRSIVINDFYKW